MYVENWTWDYGLIAPIYVHLAWIQSQSSHVACQQEELDSPEMLRVLTDKNVDDICNVMKKPGGKNADGTSDRGQQVSVMV